VCAGEAVGAPCSLGDISSSLIPNPSFEEHHSCPSSYSQLSSAKTWVQATAATSDYFVGQPSCNPTFVPGGIGKGTPFGISANDGVAFVGAIRQGDGYSEYVGACLKTPLKSGVEYTLNMAIGAVGYFYNYGGDTNGDTELLCVSSCASLPMTGMGYMGNSLPVLSKTAPSGGLKGAGDWKAITFAFTPTFDCPAVMFGPSNTQSLQAGKSGTYVIYDALNLQSGTAGSCDTEGECIP
jgi:hypothetical protein